MRISERREFQRRDELSELAREFDRMAERIEDLVVSQQQLLGDISHELRSPLARLSLALDLARRRVGDNVPEHQRIEREIHRLNELIEQLLTLARLQGESRLMRQLRPDSINLKELIHEVAQDARFEAEAAGKTVIVSSDVDSTLRGSRALLRSAIENVVRNAVRHAPEQSAVTMTMTRDEGAGRVAIVVTDRGPGVRRRRSAGCSIRSIASTKRGIARAAAWDWDWRSRVRRCWCTAARRPPRIIPAADSSCD